MTTTPEGVVDRVERYAKSPFCTPAEHDDIMVAVQLARRSLASTNAGEAETQDARNAFYAESIIAAELKPTTQVVAIDSFLRAVDRVNPLAAKPLSAGEDDDLGCEYCRNDGRLNDNNCCPKCDAQYPDDDDDAAPAIEREGVSREDFLTQLRRVNEERYYAWTDGGDAGIMFDALELGGEVGELLNVVKKLEREERGWRGSRATDADFADECADVVICLDKLARRRGVDLAVATIAKFNATSDKVGLPHKLALSPTPIIEREAYERAAKVADHFAANAHSEGMSEEIVMARSYAAYDVATAIRALIPGGDDREDG